MGMMNGSPASAAIAMGRQARPTEIETGGGASAVVGAHTPHPSAWAEGGSGGRDQVPRDSSPQGSVYSAGDSIGEGEGPSPHKKNRWQHAMEKTRKSGKVSRGHSHSATPAVYAVHAAHGALPQRPSLYSLSNRHSPLIAPSH